MIDVVSVRGATLPDEGVDLSQPVTPFHAPLFLDGPRRATGACFAPIPMRSAAPTLGRGGEGLALPGTRP